MATDLGSDVSTFLVNDEGEPDLDPSFAWIDGERGLLERCARRVMTALGTLRYATDETTIDVREWIGRSFKLVDIQNLNALVEDVLTQEDGVASSSVAASFEASSRKLTLRCAIRTATGVLRFVLSIDQVSVQLLRERA